MFSYGAPFLGSASSWLNEAPAAIAEDPEGGYWVAPPSGRVQNFGGADTATATNPDRFSSAWTVTTPEGTKYSFGSSNEPTSNARTDSVSTLPVYMTGQGCVDDLCDLGVTWALDRVEDVHGNVVSYFYEQENNFYKALTGGGAFTHRTYTRASGLVRVEYSKASGSEGAVPPVRVHLDYEYRCELANGCTDPNATLPDYPHGLVCNFGVACTVTTPSFFTKLRLAQITTETVAAGPVVSPVNQWDLSYAFPDPSATISGDVTPARIWLDSISQTGLSGGGSITLPPVSYGYTMLANRVNAPAAGYNSTMPRLSSILNEYGGLTTFDYFQSAPPQDADIADPCWSGVGGPGYVRSPCDFFPAWAPNITAGQPGGWVLWNKYKVNTLTRTSNFGATGALALFYSAEVLDYSYGPPTWAYSDTAGYGDLWDVGTVCATEGTCNNWNDFRGHRTVTVADATGASVFRSFTGLDGDPESGSDATAIDSLITRLDGTGSFVDEPWLAGRPLDVARQSNDTPPVLETRTHTFYNATVTAGVGSSRDSRWCHKPSRTTTACRGVVLPQHQHSTVWCGLVMMCLRRAGFAERLITGKGPSGNALGRQVTPTWLKSSSRRICIQMATPASTTRVVSHGLLRVSRVHGLILTFRFRRTGLCESRTGGRDVRCAIDRCCRSPCFRLWSRAAHRRRRGSD